LSLVNAKKKITGSDTHVLSGTGPIDTHVADLTGDATQAESTNNSNNINKSGTAVDFNDAQGEFLPAVAGTNAISVTITTPADSLVVIAASASSVNLNAPAKTLHVRILDGTTTLKSDSISVSSSSDGILTVLFIGVPLTGSRTYNVQVWTVTTSQLLLAVALNVSHVRLTDTHAASLSGSAGSDTHALGGDNTQDTNASESLP